MIQGSNFPTASTPDTESAEDFLAAPTSFGPSFPSEFPFEDEPRKGKKKGKGSDGMGLRTPMPSEPSLFMFPRPNHCRCVFTWPPPILPHAKEPHLPLIESEFLQSTNRSRFRMGGTLTSSCQST